MVTFLVRFSTRMVEEGEGGEMERDREREEYEDDEWLRPLLGEGDDEKLIIN